VEIHDFPFLDCARTAPGGFSGFGAKRAAMFPEMFGNAVAGGPGERSR
jgi:hypothetical protein